MDKRFSFHKTYACVEVYIHRRESEERTGSGFLSGREREREREREGGIKGGRVRYEQRVGFK